MRIADIIRDEKLNYDSITETASTSALSSSKIDNYEYLTWGQILLPDKSKIIEQAKFAYWLNLTS